MNIGVIGLGYWGPNIVRNFLSNENIDKVVCCDLSDERLTKIKKQFHSVITTKNIDEVLNDITIDAVAVVTPVDTHYSIAKKALLKGKHILVEKPFTSTVAEATELLELADKMKLKIMVDHTFLYTPAVQKIKSLVDNGEIGDILYFDSTRINLGLFQRDVNVIWDLAPHDFSIMNYIINKKPISLNAMGADHVGKGLEDVAYVHVNFGNNLIAHFHVNWLSPVKIRKVLIGGSKKMIVFDDMENSEKIKIFDTGIEIQNKDDEYQKLINYRLGDIYSPLLNNAEALSALIKDFINTIKTDAKPIASGLEGLKVVQLLEATQKSIKNNGKEISL